MKLADVIHIDYLLIPVIGRFGIQLGFGNRTVAEICAEKNLEQSFFLEILNSYHNKDYFTKDQYEKYSVGLIINYLRSTHAYYRTVKVPELENMVELFIQSSLAVNKSNNILIADFFKGYKNELIKHLDYEENTLFPYTLKLEEALEKTSFSNDLLLEVKSNQTEHEDEDHNNLEAKLYDLKNLIIKFLPPVRRSDILEKLLIELFRLEKDLNDHSRIEDKVLVPKIILMEKKILELSE